MKAILVVDDEEEALRSLYAEALNEAGYVVFKAVGRRGHCEGRKNQFSSDRHPT